ncbi:MAG: hypothetical protein CMD96_06045 [Gammaproteobacteria bacterium]|nr:hypothetical protein [Gammaproteobacteria bacterium]|tara:strand:- start:2762 stop:4675 length:1914 start_codon:yes stop_codon:yes gene_type:complete
MLKNNKVLFINPAGWQKESINLGLSCLSGALKKAGFPTLILDINRYEMSDSDLKQRVKKYSPGIIGISVKTATSTEGGRIANLLSSVCPDSYFLVGGPHVTLCVEKYMRDFPVFHYAIMGEGEECIVELVEALSCKKSIDKISGLVFRKNGHIISNSWKPPADLDNLPLPDLDAIERFDWHGFRYPVVTSRGCPFLCTYCCVNKLTNSRKWRSRSPKNVVDELKHVVRTKGINSFEIWDDNFTLDVKRSKEICRELINEAELNLSWYCHNGIRADKLDYELATLMKQAGCTSIAFGIESGNAEVFDTIKKGESLSSIVDAVKLIKKVGIKAVGYFIIGLPGDTLDTFIETVRFQHSLKLESYIFGMLIPYPKTEVWDIVQNQGKMLCDITDAQHFNSNIVPISFELPDFPKDDMIRAFYISKFFELYETVQQMINCGEMPVVVYITTPQADEYLPGIFIACNPLARHIVVKKRGTDTLSKLPSFSQVPEKSNIEYCHTIPRNLSKSTTIFVYNEGLMTMSLLFSNTNMFRIFPRGSGAFIFQMRKRIKCKLAVLGSVLSIIGLSKCILNNVEQFGTKKIGKILLNLILRRIKPLLYGMIKLLFSPWYVFCTASTKRELRLMKARKRDFPYDDYSSYM